MKTITITLKIDGEETELWRRYDLKDTADSLLWGDRIVDMLDTLEKIKEEKF